MFSSTNTRLFQLLPIDWQAIGAIATFLAVTCSFITLFFYIRKEREQIRREIGEKILEKLNRELEKIKNCAKSCQMYFSSFLFSWQELKKTILSYHNEFRSLRESFNKFEELLESKRILAERRKDLEKVVNESIYICLSDYFNFRSLNEGRVLPLELILLRQKNQQKLEEIRHVLNLRDEMDYFEITTWFGIEGDGYWIYMTDFYNLTFEGATFKENKEKIINSFSKKGFKKEEISKKWKLKILITFKMKTSPHQEQINLSEYVSEDIFETISRNVRESIEKDSELNEFIKTCREIYEKASNLQQQIEKFLVKHSSKARKFSESRIKG
jgi:hypothetical protein